MALITLNDCLVIITSHVASIQRNRDKGDWGALRVFFDGIAKTATEAASYCEAKENPDGLEPAPNSPTGQ